MKSIPTPTKSQIERVANEVNETAMKCVEDNVALLLITLARACGFGSKRLNNLIDRYDEVKKEYQSYCDDDIFEEKINAELNAIGVDPGRIYSNQSNIKIQIQKEKKKQENKQLSIKEQYEIKRLIEEMRKCL